MGFTKGKGRELAIFNLMETVLYRQFANRQGPAKHQRTFMLVSDEADAFDGMDRKVAEIALFEMGVRGKWWLLESNMTARQEVRVAVHGQLSVPYNRTGGAAQGAVLTPTKYSAVKSYLQERMEDMGLGAMVGGLCITGVSHADDGAALEESDKAMNWVLEQYEKESANIGNTQRKRRCWFLARGAERKEHGKWGPSRCRKRDRRCFLAVGWRQTRYKGQGHRSKRW